MQMFEKETVREKSGGKHNSSGFFWVWFFTAKQPIKQTSFFVSDYLKGINHNYYVIILFSLKIQKSVREELVESKK